MPSGRPTHATETGYRYGEVECYIIEAKVRDFNTVIGTGLSKISFKAAF